MLRQAACILASLLATLVSADKDAVGLDRSAANTKLATSSGGDVNSRLFSGNSELDAGILGVGLGVVGAIAVGEILKAEEKKKHRCRRSADEDEASLRFLDFGGGSKDKYECPPYYPPPRYPPAPAHHGYHPQQPGPYRPPPAPAHGYHAAKPPMYPPAPYPSYPPPAHHAPAPYYPPPPAHHKPQTQYQPTPSYHRPSSSYAKPTPSYDRPTYNNNQNYRPPPTYQEPYNSRPLYNQYQRPSGYRPPHRNADEPVYGLNPRAVTPKRAEDKAEEEPKKQRNDASSDHVRFGEK